MRNSTAALLVQSLWTSGAFAIGGAGCGADSPQLESRPRDETYLEGTLPEVLQKRDISLLGMQGR